MRAYGEEARAVDEFDICNSQFLPCERLFDTQAAAVVANHSPSKPTVMIR